jgi:hypothetical protein
MKNLMKITSAVIIFASFTQAHADQNKKTVTGDQALQVANQMKRSGPVQDGIMTSQGPASRVFGTFKNKAATCDFLWGHSEPLQCDIDSSINVNCLTSSGMDIIVKEYIAKGYAVPACGPDCARQFIINQSCGHP